MQGLDGVLQRYATRGLRPWLEAPVASRLRRWEVVCRCGICFRCSLSPDLKELWEHLRESVGVPLRVNSGVRCSAHQASVNPSPPNSLHVSGEALDIAWPSKLEREFFLERAEEAVGDGGFGLYRWGVHIDTGKGRGSRRRWKDVGL